MAFSVSFFSRLFSAKSLYLFCDFFFCQQTQYVVEVFHAKSFSWLPLELADLKAAFGNGKWINAAIAQTDIQSELQI